MKYLWERAFTKSKGAGKLIKSVRYLQQNLYLYGTTKNINTSLDSYLHQQKPGPLIIMPSTTFKKVWNIIIVILLLYTATFVPYKTSFYDEDP